MGRPKKDTKSGAKGSEGAAEAWDDAAAEANGGASKAQGRLPLDADEEQVRIELELPSPLTPTGLLHAAQKMASAQRTLEKLDKDLADLKAAQADDRKLAVKERTQYAKEVETGSSWALVPCIEVHRFRTRTVSVYRIDGTTGELGEHVRDRPMTAEELEKATFEVRTDERIELPAGAEVH